MNSFYLAFSVVCPLFLMMALGYLLRKLGFFNERLLNELNSLCFKVFLPILLFINVYQSDAVDVFQPQLVIFAVVSVVASYLLVFISVPFLEKENNKRGVLIQGIFRSNFILFGITMTISLYGNDYVGTTAVLIAFVIPIFNILSVIALEVFSAGQVNHKKIWIGILTNPLILASVIAFFFVLTGLRLPAIIETTTADIAKVATPLAFIILGGSFKFSRIINNIKPILIGVSGRLIVIPVVFLSIAIGLGFRNEALGALLALLASPTAVSSFVMAQQMEGDGELAGQLVVISSFASIVTIFIWIAVLKQGNFL
nr:AEC family transporter [uncultured Acetobacterium sp.]